MSSDLNIKVLKVLFVSLLLFFPGCERPPEKGDKAPDFFLPDLLGKEVSLKEHRGKVVLLDFWALGCPPCRVAIPELIKLQEKYRDKEFLILGISLDNKERVPDRYLRAFKEKANINYPILRYEQKILEDYFGEEDLKIPTVFIVDRKGTIQKKIVGLQPETLKRSLSEILE